MNALAEVASTDIQRGIAALYAFIGEEVAQAWLEKCKPRYNEAEAFTFPLPVDFAGTARYLRIGFPLNFPRAQLALQVHPSPWLQWPHAMKDGVCLHGLRQRPIMGTPESIVTDSLRRLGKILELSVDGSDPARRAAEFQTEITSYWSHQLKSSTQSLLLLNRPAQAAALYVLSDPRRGVRSGWETLWLSDNTTLLRGHHERVVGIDRPVRALASPAFYLKAKTYPPVEVPQADAFFEWLAPHLAHDDLPVLLAWLEESETLATRWVVIELPGQGPSPLFCVSLRSKVLQPQRGPSFGLRASRRRQGRGDAPTPAVLRVAKLDLLERSTVHSRELSGLADSLEQRRVVLVGVGSLGSPVATLLARAGVGHLTLIDPDTLVGENLGRHALGMDELGESKASALRTRLQRDLPVVRVDAYDHYVEVVLNARPEIFDKADLVIVTTADWASEVALWRAKKNGARWPLLQAWSEPHALVGHALIATNPHVDGRPLFNAQGDFLERFTEWPNGGVVPLPACGGSFIPGGVSGLADVASMIVKGAIRVLRGTAPATAWLSSISTPDDVARLGGRYIGPSLESGQMQVTIERPWPNIEVST